MMTIPTMPAARNRRIRLMPDLAGYITTQEAAQKLGYHIIYVRRMVRKGKLQGQHAGRVPPGQLGLGFVEQLAVLLRGDGLILGMGDAALLCHEIPLLMAN